MHTHMGMVLQSTESTNENYMVFFRAKIHRTNPIMLIMEFIHLDPAIADIVDVPTDYHRSLRHAAIDYDANYFFAA